MVRWGCSVSRVQKTWSWSLLFKVFRDKYFAGKKKLKINFKTAKIVFFFSATIFARNMIDFRIMSITRERIRCHIDMQPSRAVCNLTTCPNADWLSIIGFQVGDGVIQQTVKCTRNLQARISRGFYFAAKITTSPTSCPDEF